MDMTVPGEMIGVPARGGPIVTAVMDHRFFRDLRGKRSRRGWLRGIVSEITISRVSVLTARRRRFAERANK